MRRGCELKDPSGFLKSDGPCVRCALAAKTSGLFIPWNFDHKSHKRQAHVTHSACDFPTSFSRKVYRGGLKAGITIPVCDPCPQRGRGRIQSSPLYDQFSYDSRPPRPAELHIYRTIWEHKFGCGQNLVVGPEIDPQSAVPVTVGRWFRIGWCTTIGNSHRAGWWSVHRCHRR